ncbi:MAG TPA: NADH dehydrogenase (quinone) subunit D [Chloroflexota bacterium]|nr:NADH dehydrogenase (quinone) subunit D [Chloroflexota bacterium]
MTVNMGPQHPSTHGVLRIILTLDGETVVDAVPDIGFLHTGIEKSIQWKRYEAALTCTDRMDYLSPLSNNLGYCLAVEKLLGLEIPPRATWLRVMLVELQRIASHLVWLGTHALDLGAMTVFLYCFREREMILDLFEELTGQRMMTSYIRFGGVELEVPDGWLDRVHAFIDPFPNRVDEYERLLTKNGIWKERLTGVGVISGQEAIEWGLNGPSLRGSGVARDLRRQEPYLVYDQLKFEVPVRTEGDCYARYLVRVAELRQTREIVVQCLKNLPGGPIRSDDRKVVPPPKDELANSMEAVIHHFKLLTEGLKPPIGEVYQAIESPRGELGFYLVSDGSNRPRRCHVRAPSFANLQALPRLCRGHLVADVVAIIGSIDIVLGEIDR